MQSLQSRILFEAYEVGFDFVIPLTITTIIPPSQILQPRTLVNHWLISHGVSFYVLNYLGIYSMILTQINNSLALILKKGKVPINVCMKTVQK